MDLSVVTNSSADGLFFVFCSRNILTKLVGYQQPVVSVSRWNSWLELFRFHVNCIHFRVALFVHVGSAQLLYGKWCFVLHVQRCGSCRVSTNIRHSSTPV